MPTFDFSKYQQKEKTESKGKKDSGSETDTKKVISDERDKKSKSETKTKKPRFETPKKLKGDKTLSKNEIIKYITHKLEKKSKKYTLDYLRALKYNLDAIDIAK